MSPTEVVQHIRREIDSFSFKELKTANSGHIMAKTAIEELSSIEFHKSDVEELEEKILMLQQQKQALENHSKGPVKKTYKTSFDIQSLKF